MALTECEVSSLYSVKQEDERLIHDMYESLLSP